MSYQDIIDVTKDLNEIRVRLWEIARDLVKAEEKRLEQKKET
ncbi:hypothetical protein ES708_11373 [subsurface metagenome]